MLNGLTLIAALGSFGLFMCALNDSVELAERKSEERREATRQKVYAKKRVEWQKNQNRRELWEEYAHAGNQN